MRFRATFAMTSPHMQPCSETLHRIAVLVDPGLGGVFHSLFSLRLSPLNRMTIPGQKLYPW
jgi:hypothetical protein